ncbi:MAG: antibiotic biosynthesis monooxygenase [Deltaproteobacteria bacterium]|nr:antibiotic biosynthesis monooxygenase [Deltaproteobacteria bacterium]
MRLRATSPPGFPSERGRGPEFEAAIALALRTVMSRARGMLGAEVRRSLESPDRYLLTVRWATLEDHTVHFRGGPLFAEWRGIIGPFFAAPPVVEHLELVVEQPPSGG